MLIIVNVIIIINKGFGMKIKVMIKIIIIDVFIVNKVFGSICMYCLKKMNVGVQKKINWEFLLSLCNFFIRVF